MATNRRPTMTDETDDEAVDEQDSEAETYPINVDLTQTATIEVRAESREEAWEALRQPHDPEVDAAVVQTDFSGKMVEPRDVDPTEYASDDPDIDLTDNEGDD